jgi:hypothetical protein
VLRYAAAKQACCKWTAISDSGIASAAAHLHCVVLVKKVLFGHTALEPVQKAASAQAAAGLQTGQTEVESMC